VDKISPLATFLPWAREERMVDEIATARWLAQSGLGEYAPKLDQRKINAERLRHLKYEDLAFP